MSVMPGVERPYRIDISLSEGRRLLRPDAEIQRPNRHLEITRHWITSFSFVEHKRSMGRKMWQCKGVREMKSD